MENGTGSRISPLPDGSFDVFVVVNRKDVARANVKGGYTDALEQANVMIAAQVDDQSLFALPGHVRKGRRLEAIDW